MRCGLKPTLISVSAAALLGCAPMADAPQVRPVQSAAAGPAHDMLYESAVSAIDKRDYARALDYLQQARSRNPQDPRVLNAMGVIYDKLGRFDLSTRYYAQARDADPASKIVASNMAYSRVLQGISPQDMAKLAAEMPSETKPVTVAIATPPMAIPVAPSSSPIIVSQHHLPAMGGIPAAQIAQSVIHPSLPFIASQPVTVAATKVAVAVINPVSLPAEPAVPPLAVAQYSVMAVPSAAAKPEQPPKTVQAPAKHSDVVPGLARAVSRMMAVFKPVSSPTEQAAVHARSVANAASEKSSITTTVSHAAAAFQAPAKLQQAETATLASARGARPVLTTGHPLQVIDASGHAEKGGVVGRRLARLGWTVHATSAPRSQIETQLLYSPKNVAVAQAMQRTLPFSVRLTADNSVAGLKLTIGRDFLSWKPRTARLAVLWQSWIVAALLPQSPAKGTHP